MQDHESFASGVMSFPAPLKRQQDNAAVYGTIVPLYPPSINVGLNTCAVWLIRLHSCATLTAVRGLSPVIILHARCADRRDWIAGAVPGFNLFSKIIRPRNLRPVSACSLCHRGESMFYSWERPENSPLHPLRFQPRQPFDALPRNCNHTIPALRVV
jgi:hypothetical protein